MFHFFPKAAFVLALVGAMIASTVDAHAGHRLDQIMKSNTLRVGTPGDYRPFAILENEQYVGHDIELIQKMADVYGWKVDFVRSNWADLEKDLAADKFDIAVGGISRSTGRFLQHDFLPAYAPYAKVALINKKNKDRFTTLESLNRPDVRVIKNPGGSNEQFVDTYLIDAQVTTVEDNSEIPAMIAEDQGDVMITENPEAILYARKYPELYVAFMDNPLTPVNYMGFMLPDDDPDYSRVMNYLWNLMELRGVVRALDAKWIK